MINLSLRFGKNMNHTNIYEIKKIAKDFLYMKIIITDLSPMFVVHPFFENGIILSETKDKIFNIVENKKRSSVHTSTNGKENRSIVICSSDISSCKKIIQINFLQIRISILINS